MASGFCAAYGDMFVNLYKFIRCLVDVDLGRLALWLREEGGERCWAGGRCRVGISSG